MSVVSNSDLNEYVENCNDLEEKFDILHRLFDKGNDDSSMIISVSVSVWESVF